MIKIQCLNKISRAGTDRFGPGYLCGRDIEKPDAVLVRSASLHEMDFPRNLLAVARAGAGVNNIPLDRCSSRGIAVFNTPGANANAVKELTVAMLFLVSRKIVSGVDWCRTLRGKGDEVGKLIEKGKSQFSGPEISGKALGVIGLGAIGIRVANAASALGMQVYGYDPYLSVDAAWGLSRSVRHSRSLDEIYSKADYLTIHVPLLPSTEHMISAESVEKMKTGVRILNFARGGLVDSRAVIDGIHSGKIACYATDFPDDALLGEKEVIPVPHLGASTPESEDNCARMAVDELKEYLETGNIRNSVNLPAVSMPHAEGCGRLCLIHRNIPNTISKLSGILASAGINIENMQSRAKGEYAYTLLDVTGAVSDATAERLEALAEIVRARVAPAG